MATRVWKYWCMFCNTYADEVMISQEEPDDGPLCCNDTRMIAVTQGDEDGDEG